MYTYAAPLVGLILMAAVAIHIYPCRESDRALYRELLQSSNPQVNEANLSYSQQLRKEVNKQVWYQGETPLQIQIYSEDSELFFFKQAHQIEVIEQLGTVTCMMQEELYFLGDQPMQRIRYLEADEACYNYNSHLFIAKEAKLWKYQLEGHDLPKQKPDRAALMHARAHSVEFTLKGEKLDFIAHQMKAVVNTKDREL